MNNYFFILFFVVLISSCSTQQNKRELLGSSEYIIDLDGKREPTMPLSSFFKEVRTIILETKDDCLIGTVADVQVFDGYIFILDSYKAKGLFVFDMEGKFIRKIGGIGRGPGEYVEIYDFTYDKKERTIYLLAEANKVLKYNLDGTHIQTMILQAPRFSVKFIQFFDGRLYAATILGIPTEEDDYMLLETNPNDGSLISRSLPVKYNKGWSENYLPHQNRFFMSRAHNPPRYNQLFMDYIVSIGNEITPYIELKSKNLTTEKDIESFRSMEQLGLNFDPRKIISSSKTGNVHSFIENDDFIHFICGLSLNRFIVIYLKKTGDVKLVNYLTNDLIYKNDQKGNYSSFMFADEKGAYAVFDIQLGFGLINSLKSSIRNNETVSGLDKADELMKLDEESNPVIFFYEFK